MVPSAQQAIAAYRAQKNRLNCASISEGVSLSWHFSHFPDRDYGNGNAAEQTTQRVWRWQVTVRLLLGWCPGALRRNVTLCPSDLLRKSRTTPCSLANSSACICFGNQVAIRAELLSVSHTFPRYNSKSLSPLLGQQAAAWIICRIRYCSYKLCNSKWQLATVLFKSYSASR